MYTHNKVVCIFERAWSFLSRKDILSRCSCLEMYNSEFPRCLHLPVRHGVGLLWDARRGRRQRLEEDVEADGHHRQFRHRLLRSEEEEGVYLLFPENGGQMNHLQNTGAFLRWVQRVDADQGGTQRVFLQDETASGQLARVSKKSIFAQLEKCADFCSKPFMPRFSVCTGTFCKSNSQELCDSDVEVSSR